MPMTKTGIDFFTIRKLFPMIHRRVHSKPLVYLDSVATTFKPQSVINTITTFYKTGYATVHRAIYNTAVLATENYEATRHKACSFLNAKSENEIIFVKGTTEAINLVAHSFTDAFITAGDSIIISEMEHHSNIVPWQLAAKRKGAVLKVIPVLENGELDFQAFLKLLDNKTKMVAVTHVSNVLGTINPLKKIIEAAHAHGAKVFVDGAQAVSHHTIDVQDLDCDFYAFSGHKMYGPTGIGVLYGKEELLDKMPPYQTGGDMVDTVTFENTTFDRVPQKFEAGTPMIAGVMAMAAVFDFLHETGIDRIQAWENELFDALWAGLSRIPKVKILGQKENRNPLVTFTVDGVHPLDLATLLDLQGIAVRSGHLCAQPLLRRYGLTSACRASIGMYNTKDEIHFFIDKLEEVVSGLV